MREASEAEAKNDLYWVYSVNRRLQRLRQT
jgi:hypothetical protein